MDTDTSEESIETIEILNRNLIKYQYTERVSCHYFFDVAIYVQDVEQSQRFRSRADQQT